MGRSVKNLPCAFFSKENHLLNLVTPAWSITVQSYISKAYLRDWNYPFRLILLAHLLNTPPNRVGSRTYFHNPKPLFCRSWHTHFSCKQSVWLDIGSNIRTYNFLEKNGLLKFFLLIHWFELCNYPIDLIFYMNNLHVWGYKVDVSVRFSK